ncbi:MAG: hypothetical protein IKA04_06130 [Alistipes sp.]|nr:hypothetical protein [Alistipes sp.]
MKRIILLIFAISCSMCLFAQGRVVVAEKNGNLTIGEIVEDNSEFIRVVKYDDKLTRIIYRSNIVSISDAGNKYKTKEELYSEAMEQARKEQEQKRLLQASDKKQLADKKQVRKENRKIETQVKQQQRIAHIKKMNEILKNNSPKGLQHSVALVYKLITGVGVDYIAGYRMKNFCIGGGAGVFVGLGPDFHNSGIIIPFYNERYSLANISYSGRVGFEFHANFRWYITKSRWQPFLEASIGTMISPYKTYILHIDDNYHDGELIATNKGMARLYLKPSVGINYRINTKHSISIACSPYPMTSTYVTSIKDGKVKTKTRMHSLGMDLSLGFTF